MSLDRCQCKIGDAKDVEEGDGDVFARGVDGGDGTFSKTSNGTFDAGDGGTPKSSRGIRSMK